MQDDSIPTPAPRRSNPDRSAAMRARLVAAARELFAAQGYAATGTPEIVAAAGVTRGALYHHFADKPDLFRAVVEAEAAAVAAAVAGVPAGPEALRAGTEAWFDAMAEPGRVRLLLLDGPAVLGVAEMARIEAATDGGELRAGLAAELGEGPEVTALADILAAAFNRAACAIAAGGDRAVYAGAVLGLIGRLMQEK